MQLGRTRCSHGQWTVKCSYKHKQNTCIITLTNFKNRFKVSIIHWSLFFICFRNQTAPHKSKFLICPLLTRSLMWSVNWNPQPNTRSVKFCTIYTKTNATNIKINNGERMQKIDQHFNSWQSFFFNFNSTLLIFYIDTWPNACYRLNWFERWIISILWPWPQPDHNWESTSDHDTFIWPPICSFVWIFGFPFFALFLFFFFLLSN